MQQIEMTIIVMKIAVQKHASKAIPAVVNFGWP